MTGNYDITWEQTVDPAGKNCGPEGYMVSFFNVTCGLYYKTNYDCKYYTGETVAAIYSS